MDVKKFIGMCARRNQMIIIRDEYAHLVAKGTIKDVYFNNNFEFLAEHIPCEEILKREIDCFDFSDEKLYIMLK